MLGPRAAFRRASARCARSANEIARSVPTTRTVPPDSANSRSPAAASSALPASALRLVGQLVGGARDRCAAARDRARAAGAGAGRDQIGVALDHAHVLGRKPQTLGDELRIGGVVALPGRLRADQHGDAAVGIEPHGRGVRAVVAAGLDIGGDPDAAQPPARLRGRVPAPRSPPNRRAPARAPDGRRSRR